MRGVQGDRVSKFSKEERLYVKVPNAPPMVNSVSNHPPIKAPFTVELYIILARSSETYQLRCGHYAVFSRLQIAKRDVSIIHGICIIRWATQQVSEEEAYALETCHDGKLPPINPG